MRLLVPLSLILLLLGLEGVVPLKELSSRDANGKYRVYRVGVVLDMNSLAGRIGMSCLSMALSDFYSLHTNFTTRIVFYVKDSKGNVIDAAASALYLLHDVRVDAIIGPQKSGDATFVMNLGDRSHTPIISFTATSPGLHHRTPYFVQTTQSDENQVGAIVALIKTFHWRQVVLVYEDTDYGNGVISYLANALQKVDVQVPYRSIIPLSASDELLAKELYKLMTMQTRVFIVHMSHSLASRLFLIAKEQRMMSKGYAWIITSGLTDLLYMMDSHDLEAMQGVLGVRPLIPKSKKNDLFASRWKREFLQKNSDIRQAELGILGLWAYDTLWAIALAVETIGTKEGFVINDGVPTNQTDIFHLPISETGPKLLKVLSETTFNGYSGEFHLVDGHLKQSSFQILNVVGKGEREVGIWRPYSGVRPNMNILKNRFGSIIWPGESTDAPKGWEIPSSGEKLKIGVYGNEGITELVNVERDLQLNATKVSGYIIDIFDSVMKKLPYAVPYEYIPFGNSSSGENYNDLVDEVFRQNFDAVVGATIITVNRSLYVDFTLPFEEGGIVLITPIKSEDMNNRWAFLKPLDRDLWLATIAFFIFTGIVFWLIEHRINPEFRGSPPQHLGLILWFPLLTLVFAQRERIVSNFTKLVEVTWVFVVLILSSTYTASLSSRLTVQKLQPTITKLEELIKNDHYVGYIEGSFIVDYLKKMGFEAIKLKPYKYLDDFDKGLSDGSQNGGISAFFVATLHSKLFLSKYCDKYMRIGPTYPTNGLAFVFQKGSPLIGDVSRAIIDLTESDSILKIRRKYIGSRKCTGLDSSTTPNSVTLQSFGALFIIYGVVAIMCLLAYMIKYVYKNKEELQRILYSNTTTWAKICEICRHYDQKDSSVRSLRGSTS